MSNRMSSTKMFAVAWACALSACASAAEYVWVDEVEEGALVAPVYRIQPGDRLAIAVWNQEHLSGEARVRDDGRATVPLVGDVPVGGVTASEAATLITQRLHGLVLSPKVTVAIVEARPATITVIGEVRAPGNVPYVPGDRLLDALARAGGLTEFATDDLLFVIREGDSPMRVRFDYERLTRAQGRGVAFRLRPGDIVVVY
jgi:polysaccharide biosynthesis/export protein